MDAYVLFEVKCNGSPMFIVGYLLSVMEVNAEASNANI